MTAETETYAWLAQDSYKDHQLETALRRSKNLSVNSDVLCSPVRAHAQNGEDQWRKQRWRQATLQPGRFLWPTLLGRYFIWK